jgi:hypothetical protein
MENEQNAPAPAQPGGWLNWVRPQPQPQPPMQPQREVELPEEIAARLARAVRMRLEEEAVTARLNAEAAQRTRQLENLAYYSLREQMIGKKLDSTWMAYASNSVRDYLEKQNVFDPKTRVDVIESAIQRYIAYLHDEKQLTLTDILSIRAHNRNVKGLLDHTVWWNPWTWHRTLSISENESGSSHESTLYSGTQIMMTGFMAVGLTIGGLYITSRLCSSLRASFTTPKVALPPTLPTQIAIHLPSSVTTALETLSSATNISNNLLDIQPSSLDNSTSIELMTTLKERFINRLLIALKRAVDIVAEYSHSQR